WDFASIKREPATPAVALDVKQIDTLWADLASDDAAKANQGRLTLASAAKQVVPFLQEKIKPAVGVDPKKIAGWVADLDSSNFQKRSLANSELDKLGELAVPALQKALDAGPTVETRRRIETLLEKALSGDLGNEQIRIVRAMQVLERA